MKQYNSQGTGINSKTLAYNGSRVTVSVASHQYIKITSKVLLIYYPLYARLYAQISLHNLTLQTDIQLSANKECLAGNVNFIFIGQKLSEKQPQILHKYIP